MNTQSPTVSVVIPSVGRDTLQRAVDSVRAQSFKNGAIEIIVVFDLPKPPAHLLDSNSPLVRVLTTGGGRGGSAARNLGTRSAQGAFIAYLDDDDVWRTDKIAHQLSAASQARGELILISSQHRHVVSGDARPSPIPSRVYSSPQPLTEYLFRRRPPRGGRPSMYTSTLLVSRALAELVGWDETLRRHQDWDFVVRCGDVPGVEISQIAAPLVDVHVGSENSISAQSDWRSSLEWARSQIRWRDKRTFVDFVTAQTLRYALNARSLEGVRACATEIGRARRIPSTGPIFVAISGLLPRRLLVKLMKVI